MKETELRVRYHASISPDHDNNCYIVEKRISGFWVNKWKRVDTIKKTDNINSCQKALEFYMKTFLNVTYSNEEELAYTRIKRL